MDRRRFLTGGVAVVVTGTGALAVFSRVAGTTSPALAQNTLSTEPTVCTMQVEDLSAPQTEILIKALRDTLDTMQVLHVDKDILKFYHSIYDQYAQKFGEDEESAEFAEVIEAAEILNDPECYVPAMPEDGCTYFEAWKFFAHHKAMEIYPADGSRPFASLSKIEQYEVAMAGVVYASMVTSLFPSLMESRAPAERFNAAITALDIRKAEIEAEIVAGMENGCGKLPMPKREPYRQPVPVAGVIRYA